MTVQDIPLPPTIRPDPPRDQWGRYVLTSPVTNERQSYTRVSTLKSAMQDTYGLNQWKLRTTLQGLAYHQLATDEQVAAHGGSRVFDRLVALVKDEDDMSPTNFKRALGQLVDEAFDIGGGKWASDMGTALHAWCEFVDLELGTVEEVPDMFRSHVQAYLDALAKAGILVRKEYIERIVVNEAYGVAGTFDRVYELADGTLAVGDIKSGSSIDLGWLEIAQQMAAYQTADAMLDDSDEWTELPELRTDFAVIAHCPITIEPARCRLVPMPLAEGRSALNSSAEVRRWREQERKQKTTFDTQFKLPSADTLLVAAINKATTAAELGALYEQHEAIWTDAHTLLGKRRLAKV